MSNDDLREIKVKEYRIKEMIERLAQELVYFNEYNEDITLDQAIKQSYDEYRFNKEDKKHIEDSALKLLKKKYNLTIKCNEPLSFNNINCK